MENKSYNWVKGGEPCYPDAYCHLGRILGTQNMEKYKNIFPALSLIFLDINTISWALFEEMGLDNARNAFYMTNYALKEVYNMTDDEIAVYPNSNISLGGADLIHFSWDGAKRVAELVAGELAKCDDNIAQYVK